MKPPARISLTAAALGLLFAACGGDTPPADGGSDDAGAAAAAAAPAAPIPALLAARDVVFGVFSGDHTREQGRVMGSPGMADFVFYSLESGPFDIETMRSFMEGMAETAAGAPPPLVLRIPPVKDGAEEARAHVAEALAAGVAGVVFPHVWSRDDASLAVEAMGDDLWPANPSGRLVNMLIVEDREGLAQLRDIVSTPGVSVVFAGPGDLRRTFGGDMEQVEAAIQQVLAACIEFSVPCGITAGVDDIAARIEEGFQVIIVTEPDAIAVGRSAAGR